MRFPKFDLPRMTMRWGGTLLAFGIRAWMRTLDSRIVCYDPKMDPAVANFDGPAIYVVWHEYLALPPCHRRGCDVTMLLSQHRDAHWLTEVIGQFGFKTVRGSTSRGGVQAILQIRRINRGTSLVITPDGPRGPRRELSGGCVFLAGLLGIPIVPLGCGFDRPWRNTRAWDKFAIPRPSTRARIVLGPAIRVPRKLSKDDIEEYRVYIESTLGLVTQEAETWAADGSMRVGERGFYPVPQGAIQL
ncbi:MAG TPA: lysophospholipid acyltransferase family protein [Pirellula sp.]|nr:lysophospholipid acyltransferase family protein [Pirellula sp.]